MNDELVVGGYLFTTTADAVLAKEELAKIEYLDANMNYANTAKVMQLYDKAVDTQMFKTPVGWAYLNKLKLVLMDNGYLESEFRPVTVYSVFAKSDNDVPLAEKIRPQARKKKDPYKNKFTLAVCIIGVLIIAVIAMFAIALQSETPNMINYRNAIVNEYAEWEQDIKSREDAVRTKERELGMPSPLPHEEQMKVSNNEEE